MPHLRKFHRRLGTPLVLFLLAVPVSLAQVTPAQEEEEERKYGWFDTGELSFVQTDGNSEASSFSLRNVLSHVWENATFSLDAGALRVETTTISRFATGTPTDFTLSEDKNSEVTAENYFLRGRYDRQITDTLYWYAGAGWEKNEFAGFDSRVDIGAGIGNIWFENDDSHFSTYYGVTWTSQDDIIENPEIDDSFIGVQAGWDYAQQLTGNTVYANLLVVDLNVDETDDFRADMINSLTTQMSDHLALKLSLQLLYDNLPALTEVDLVDGSGVPTGTRVLGELDELDTLFTAALVVSF